MGTSPQTAAPAPLFLDAEQVAQRYHFSPEHWRRLVDSGRAPQPSRFGRLVRWNRTCLDSWDAAGNPPVRVVKGAR